MTNSIIGTAGHVDHGKTCLIRALTGMDTDRLKEEKKRGITIDLGFAHIDLPDGSQAGIIDVPGHEKFIRNMLAGAAGIDLVLMVIAADEGIMPQTKEHIDILSFLNIKNGIVALTKADTVDGDWLEFMKEEVHAKLEGTFLENAPIVPVSSHTGKGIPELKDILFKMLKEQSCSREEKNFRLPIDRVFTMDGFGVVITGTMIEGALNVGDSLMIYPSQIETKARNIQVHSQNVDTAYSGQRTAVNLAGIKKSDIKRGDILAPKDSIAVTSFVDVKINMLKDSTRAIKNNSTVHFYHGSNELTAKVTLLDCDQILCGQSGYAQLRCSESFAAKAGDNFVLRFLSPLETIGGGTILNTMPAKRKRLADDAINTLKILESGSLSEKISCAVSDAGSTPSDINTISLKINSTEEETLKICEKLAQKKEITSVAENLYVHKSEIARIKTAATGLLTVFHKENPLKKGIKREELRTKLRPNMQIQHMDRILNQLINQKVLKEDSGFISLFEFAVVVSEDSQKIHSEILAMFKTGKFSPPSPDEVAAKYPKVKNTSQIFSKMITDGDLIRLSEKILMARFAYEEALELVKKLEVDKGEVLLADVRDVLGTSRKYALGLLEYWDSKKITRKSGDIRHFTK